MLKAKDKKNIKKFVELFLEQNKEQADYWIKNKHKYKPIQQDGVTFNLSLQVPSHLANMITKEYPKMFEKGPDLEWFKKEFDIFVM